jgi:hypothetical protein
MTTPKDAMAAISLPTDPASLSEREDVVLVYVLERFASNAAWTTAHVAYP